MSKLTYRWALNQALKEEMERDQAVFIAGVDVGKAGGPFGVTRGLLEAFGEWRVRDTPISEETVGGLAVGAAAAGLRPVVEIMFMDFLTLAMDPICNQAAKAPYVYGPKVKMPIVFLTLGGSGLRAGCHHSQSLESWFVNVPGLKVVQPSNPSDAKGLLKAAIRDDNPVVFVEHKALLSLKGEVPDGSHVVPLGQANVVRSGADITVVTYGWMVHRCLAAATALAQKGIGVEVVDLRTLWPLDAETIVASVRKTGRLLVVHEAPAPCGLGAEVGAMVAERAWNALRAPVRRLTAAHVPVPVGPYEEFVVPTEGEITAAIEATIT